jgi:hypothetical protein
MGRIAKVHLVGSVACPTTEDVFRLCSSRIGSDIVSLPDGEVGDREDYNTFVAYRILDGHPDLETVARPRMAPGKKAWWHANDLLHNTWKFRIKDSVKYPRFENLLYADAAIRSYELFRRMRDEGTIPADVRFQVSLPPPHSAAGMWFHEPDDYNRAVPAYLEAMVAEVQRLVAAIPSGDLAIQWDACHETLDVEGNLAWTPKSDPWIRFAGELVPISMYIPEDVLIGFHFCYGDIQGKHELEPKDLSTVVRMANLAANNSGRRVDWVHMPVPRGRADDTYFKPLSRLAVGATRVHLGLVHQADGVEGARKRIETAKKFLPSFGIAGECGLGRVDPAALPDLLTTHHEAAQYLA